MRRAAPVHRPPVHVVPLYKLADLAESAFAALVDDAEDWQRPALRRVLHEVADLLSAPETDDLEEL